MKKGTSSQNILHKSYYLNNKEWLSYQNFKSKCFLKKVQYIYTTGCLKCNVYQYHNSAAKRLEADFCLRNFIYVEFSMLNFSDKL